MKMPSINLCACLCGILTLTAYPSYAQEVGTSSQPGVVGALSQLSVTDIDIALPTAKELVGFDKFQCVTSNKHGQVKAIRSDGITIEISLYRRPDEVAANRTFDGFQAISAFPYHTTTWSGRRLAERVFRSNYAVDANPKPRGSFSLMLKDGVTVLSIQLTGPYAQDEKGERVRDAQGNFIPYYFTELDLQFVENTAWRILQRMTALGFGSKPASAATERARQEIQERRKQPVAPAEIKER